MFRTSTPVAGAAFHNRQAEIEQLLAAFRRLAAGAPEWVAILGQRKIGKTSLVMEAVRQARSKSFRAVILDAQEFAPVSSEFFRCYALRVLDAVFGEELGGSLEQLARTPMQYRARLQEARGYTGLPPSLRAELLEIPDAGIDAARLRAWLRLPEALAEAFDLRVAVAIDEFQDLGGIYLDGRKFDPFPLLRGIWQKHARVAYFVSGSARSMLLSLVTKEQAPFFQHFRLMELGPFSPEAASALLVANAPEAHPIPTEIAGAAVAALGGHPFYLQLLGEALVQLRRKPDRADFKAALQNLLFSRSGRLGLYFENEFNRLVGRSTFLAATLEALAHGPRTATEVSKEIRAASGATANYIDRLGDAVLKDGDGRYRLADETFGLWLRWRCPGGSVVPMTVVGDEGERAAASALAAMGFDLVYQSRASRGAFDLLGTRGSRQLGIQVKRSPLPLRFAKAEWARMEADARKLGWDWVVAAVGVDGLVQFLDPARARHGKAIQISTGAAIQNLLLWLDRR